MAEKKLIPANKDRTVLIKEEDQNCFHVRCERVTILPGDPLHPVRNSWIQVFDVATWLKFEKLGTGRNPVDWKKASLVNSAVVVHDPRLNTKN